MKFLAIEKEVPGVTDDRFTPFLNAEAEKAWELYQRGVIRELYFHRDRSEAILILECKDMDETDDVINSLPLVKNGLITFEIIPLVPYPGFARLFQK